MQENTVSESKASVLIGLVVAGAEAARSGGSSSADGSYGVENKSRGGMVGGWRFGGASDPAVGHSVP